MKVVHMTSALYFKSSEEVVQGLHVMPKFGRKKSYSYFDICSCCIQSDSFQSESIESHHFNESKILKMNQTDPVLEFTVNHSWSQWFPAHWSSLSCASFT